MGQPAVPPEAEALIDGARLMAHLATSVDDRPHVAPVWYYYEDGVVEVVTTGRKLANVRRNPRVALSIQEDDDGAARWMVAMRGRATVIEDEAANREAARRINAKYGAGETAHSQNVLVRIDVGSATYRVY